MDDDSDTREIVSADSLSPAEEPQQEVRVLKSRSSPFTCPLSITVEPVLFLSTFSLTLQMPLYTQYLWERISEDLGYNGTKGGAGGCGNTSVPHDELQKEVEALTAHWNLYISLGGFLVSLFVVILLGSWSDHAGRRLVLIVPSLGLAVQASIYLIVMYMKLPVAWFLLGRICSGLSGDFNAILAGCFAYVADTSDQYSRTFRVAILEASLGVAGMFASIIGGKWRKAQGYINPFWLVLATNLVTALYAYLFIPESVTPDPAAKLISTQHHKAVYRLYKTGGQGRYRTRLWLYTLCFFLVVTVHFGSRELYVLYELSTPLCWDSELIGYGSAAQHLAYLSSLLSLRLLQQCIDDSWVAILGLASNIAGLVAFSVANTTALMFTGYGLCFLLMTSTPVLRSKLSKLVDPSEQGALFASIACVEGLCSLIASAIFNSMYPATLHILKGFPFLFGAIILLIPAGIISALWFQERRANLRETGLN